MGSTSDAVRVLEIVEVGPGVLEDNFLQTVGDGIETVLKLEVCRGDPIEVQLDADAANASGAVVDRLIRERSADPSRWILGITTADLDAPDRRWVFGEATQGGRWALISVARLGAPGSPGPRMHARAIKEALHEIGHLAGLDHCPMPDCVMTRSGSVRAIDTKNSKFCPVCLSRLGRLART